MDYESGMLKTLSDFFVKIRNRLCAYAIAVRRIYKGKSRYSRLVFILKIALPSVGALFVGIMMVSPELEELKHIKIDVPKLESSDKISFAMDKGRFYGQGDDGMIFSLSIENFKENRYDDVMDFEGISGKVFFKDANWIDLRTDSGSYRRSDKEVILSGNVNIVDDQDNMALTDEAVLDLATSEVYGSKPIIAETYFGRVSGGGFKFKRGEKYIFTGNIKAKIDSSKLEKQQ